MSGADVLGEAAAAVAGAGEEELEADALVVADAAADVVDVGAELLAQVGHLVDEADLGRQHGVGDVLGHLGTFGRHDQERPFGAQERAVQLVQHLRRPPGLRTPTTTRSGFMKSSMAAPSLRNSGLLATSIGRPGRLRHALGQARRLVPTGTVLLMTTTASGLGRCSAIGIADGPEAAQVGRRRRRSAACRRR